MNLTSDKPSSLHLSHFENLARTCTMLATMATSVKERIQYVLMAQHQVINLVQRAYFEVNKHVLQLVNMIADMEY